MNTFMNLIKRSLIEGGTRDRVEASGEVETLVGASSLPALNPQTGPWPASSFYSPMGSAGELTRGLHQVRDSGAITMEILS